MEIHGLGDRELNAVWAKRPEACLGTTVSGFPNMFVLYGPNTNHGSGSVPFTLECQFSYAIDAISRMRAGGLKYIDLKPEVQVLRGSANAVRAALTAPPTARRPRPPARPRRRPARSRDLGSRDPWSRTA